MADREISNAKACTVTSLRDQLMGIVDKIEDALPGQLKGQAKRFIQVSLLAFATSKSRETLEKCSPASYLQSFLEACSAGFPLDNKHAYAIPYGGEVTCSFDYKALITAARRCGAIKDAWAQDVCENDEFLWKDENGRKLYTFRMCEDEDNRGEIRGAFAVAILPGDLIRFEYMTKKQLEKLQASSKSPQSPAWKNWRERMVCKGPMKRVLQGLETDSSFGLMLDADNREFDLDKIVDGRASETRVRSYDELADALHNSVAKPAAIEHRQEERYEPQEEMPQAEPVMATQRQQAAAIPPRPSRPSIGNHPAGIR